MSQNIIKAKEKYPLMINFNLLELKLFVSLYQSCLTNKFVKIGDQMKLLAIFLLIPLVLNAQTSFSEDIDVAYTNALKGAHYAIANIPERKNSISKELIDADQMVAKIKLSKEVGGVSIESTGHYKTYEVKITVRRDYESLRKEGLIDRIPLDE